mmetsp:Transcript_30567/g.101696  ORF Transcript_30567/g.101696 Transcript_30567/m.101696 type:complete len:278 (-) Transcript_30567:42-875(-)
MSSVLRCKAKPQSADTKSPSNRWARSKANGARSEPSPASGACSWSPATATNPAPPEAPPVPPSGAAGEGRKVASNRQGSGPPAVPNKSAATSAAASPAFTAAAAAAASPRAAARPPGPCGHCVRKRRAASSWEPPPAKPVAVTSPTAMSSTPRITIWILLLPGPTPPLPRPPEGRPRLSSNSSRWPSAPTSVTAMDSTCRATMLVRLPLKSSAPGRARSDAKLPLASRGPSSSLKSSSERKLIPKKAMKAMENKLHCHRMFVPPSLLLAWQHGGPPK